MTLAQDALFDLADADVMPVESEASADSAKKKRAPFERFVVRDGWIVQAYKFALDPTPAQVRDLSSHCGAARFAFNWGLALIKANLGQREAEKSYDVPAELLTSAVAWNLYGLRKAFNQAKPEAAPWWEANSKEAYNTGLANLATALRNWSASKKGTRKGPTMGFPKFKKKHKAAKSTRFTVGAIRVEDDRHHVTLPRLGTIRTFENTRKLQRRLQARTARVLSATVRFERGRWFVAFQVEVQRQCSAPKHPDSVIGVDLGIKTLAVLSTGQTVANPRHLEEAQTRLRRANRALARKQGPRKAVPAEPENPANPLVRVPPSKRWTRQKAKLAAVHARVANLRTDAVHDLTTRIARTHATIVVEDLNVAGMLKNHRLARHLAGASFGEIRRQLTYKITRFGGRLVVADRWYPSSKTCSRCQTVKAKLSLRERMFHCEACGLVIDRDLNAALNLASLVEASVGPGAAGPTPIIRWRANARGANHKTRPGRAGGVEARTAHPPHAGRGKTRTVATRGRFAEIQ